jgi:6-pyruvoyltetrahydropterin/6-carboxytetrahydropterin synthase
MVFDYRWYRDKLLQLCRSLDGHCLMPALSKYLKYKQTKDEYEFLFTNQRIILPKADVLLMPLKNITTESLAEWFLDKICNEIIEPENKFINVVSTKISSYSGQYARISRKIS